MVSVLHADTKNTGNEKHEQRICNLNHLVEGMRVPKPRMFTYAND